jgi:hypothetical protein
MGARVGTLALALLSATGTAQAETVTYTFTAVVDSVLSLQYFQGGYVDGAELDGHHMAVNDHLSGRISFDSAEPSWFFDYGDYSLATLPKFSLEYSFKSGLNDYASTYTGSARVIDMPDGDSVALDNTNYYGGTPPGLIGGAGLAFEDGSGTYLTSTALPESIDIHRPGLHSRIGGSWYRTSDETGIFFWGTLTSIQQVTVSPVPEPESALLMLAGLGAVGVAMRRKRAKNHTNSSLYNRGA